MSCGGASLRVLGFGLLLLGLCVFAWGLRYKLSLYSPPQSATHRMPAAKLLTGRDRSALPAIKLRPASEVPVSLASTLSVALLSFPAYGPRPAMRASDVPRNWVPRLFLYRRSSPAAVRPPPSLLQAS